MFSFVQVQSIKDGYGILAESDKLYAKIAKWGLCSKWMTIFGAFLWWERR